MFKRRKPDTAVVIKELQEIKELVENQQTAMEEIKETLLTLQQICIKSMRD